MEVGVFLGRQNAGPLLGCIRRGGQGNGRGDEGEEDGGLELHVECCGVGGIICELVIANERVANRIR